MKTKFFSKLQSKSAFECVYDQNIIKWLDHGIMNGDASASELSTGSSTINATKVPSTDCFEKRHLIKEKKKNENSTMNNFTSC